MSFAPFSKRDPAWRQSCWSNAASRPKHFWLSYNTPMRRSVRVLESSIWRSATSVGVAANRSSSE